MTDSANQPKDKDPIERVPNCVEETIRVFEENKDKLRLTLEDKFGVPPSTASKLVTSMAVICTEFNQFIATESDRKLESEQQLVLPDLFRDFFGQREWSLLNDDIIPSYVPEPWGFRFLNEFLASTISWGIPFVYLTGIGVQHLTIPDTDFWMDFKTSLQGTGDWNCLQSRSEKNLCAQSIISHGAMSALICLLERLAVQYPPQDLKTLFKYINAPRLICIFVHVIHKTSVDGDPPNGIDTDVDYHWENFLAMLGAFAGPRSVNLRSKSQVEEFMDIYKGFEGRFIGYIIDMHGILRFNRFLGWSEYVQYRECYYDPARHGVHWLH